MGWMMAVKSRHPD